LKNVAESTGFKVKTKSEVNIYWIKRATTEENKNGYFYNGARNVSVPFKILAYINLKPGKL
jgi:hypothetical protein